MIRAGRAVSHGLLPAVLATVLAAPVHADEPETLRLWRDVTGTYQVRAEFVDATYDNDVKDTLIQLRTAEGATITVPSKRLSEEDRRFVERLVSKRAPKPSRREIKDTSGDRRASETVEPPKPQQQTPARRGPSKFSLPIVPENGIPETVTRDRESVVLNIPPRKNAPDSPPDGWCGETAIQEALLHHGMFCPQRVINRAGNPKHPDLWSDEVPVALRNLGMALEPWPPPGPGDLGTFIQWIQGKLQEGTPVLVGVKVYPDRHRDWSLDHFVIAVGAGPQGLLFNTTQGSRAARSDAQLRSTAPGYSFENRFRTYLRDRHSRPRSRPGKLGARASVRHAGDGSRGVRPGEVRATRGGAEVLDA